MPPERVVPVAEVGEVGTEQQVDHATEAVGADPAEPGDVVALPAGPEPGALRVVRAAFQRLDEARYLGRVGRSVGVDGDQDVAGTGGEPAGHAGALSAAACFDGGSRRGRA